MVGMDFASSLRFLKRWDGIIMRQGWDNSSTIQIDPVELRTIVRQTGLSHIGIAAQIGVSPNTIGIWLKTGRIKPFILSHIKSLIPTSQVETNCNFCPSCGFNLKKVGSK